MPTFGRNKYRVYIAYFPRNDGRTYHSAIHVVPKNPKDCPGSKDVWRFDVHDIATRVGDQAVLRWTYGYLLDGERQMVLEYPGQLVDARSRKLLAMVLVGKLKASVSIDSLREFIHRAVDLNAHDANDSSWRCHNFVMEVIDAMNSGNLFSEALSQRGRDIWNNGHAFAASYRPEGFRYRSPLPVCDTNGQPIDSEIPAAPHLDLS